MTKMLYIIRGLPGSGKTTLANRICGIGLICEADQFFTDSNGIYNFDALKIKEAHKFCQDKVKNLMELGHYPIIVSNTFSRRWEMEYYYNLAKEYNFLVTEITMADKMHGNTHNVPEKTIQLMRERWEK